MTVDAVISRSGVARSTIYRHWRTRANLVYDTLDSLVPVTAPDGLDATVPLAAAPLRTRAELDERLQASLSTLVGPADPRAPAGLIPVLLVEAERDPELAGLRERVIGRLTEPITGVLSPAVEAGLLHPDVTTQDALAWLLGPLLVRRFLAPNGVDQAFVARTVAGFLLAHAP